MGRSRAVQNLAEDDPNHSRSKRKKTTSNVENIEPPMTEGEPVIEGKKALYHCNYCHKDISGKIRIKCAVCPDFDLCVECFSVGVEITPHKCNHPYRVMDDLSFPLICPDWNADEEILLLEGIEMYGLGNWNEVAEHVGAKSKAECIEHYNRIYMDSPFFPLPDLSHVMGKSREELLAMAKEHASVSEEVVAKEEPIISTKDEIEEPRNEAPAGGSSPTSTAGRSAIPKTSVGATQQPSVEAQAKDGSDGVKVEDRSIGGKKPRITAEEGRPVMEFSGYNAKRHEFEIEYDNDAEQLLADMEFKDTDTEAEREIKLRVLGIYSRRLDERKRRKDFIIERNLLFPDPFLKSLSPEERELCQRYRVFMRFHSKQEHEELLMNVVEEHRIVKRIKDLQEARAAGCRTSSEADRYIGQKRRREAEEDARRVNESVEAAPSGKILLRVKSEFNGSPRGNTRGPSSLDAAGKNTAITSFLDEWDLTGFPGVDLLSESEKRLCQEMKILPSHYLNMIKVMSMEIMKGNITKRSDAYGLFKVDTSKVDRIYDMLQKKGIAV
ncbi:hypothetical protein Droror1_Dr00002962 [Drosera rotundifolia]